jgi:hypothetical protein
MPVHASDLRGYSRLGVDALAGLTDLVEAMHLSIAGAAPEQTSARGITGLVYAGVRGVAGLVGQGLDLGLARLVTPLAEGSSWPGREALLAALNGVLGDYLAASANPLAISMCLRREGRTLVLDARALAAAIPRPSGKLVVLAHGLCMNDLQWNRNGHEHGAALARDLGYTPVYLHYNSGRHVSDNGRELAALLEALLSLWPVPVEELVLIGHSAGGLVARSACHYGAAAGHDWLRPLRKLVFLGTPHHGAPLERGGNWIEAILGFSAYSAPLARLGRIRSAGITDLRYGNLLDEDWRGRDRFARSRDRRRPVPLPPGVRCYAMAATTGKRVGRLRDTLVGDGLVPSSSALGRHRDPARSLPFPESSCWVGRDLGHLDLLDDAEVYEQIRRWLAA